MAAERSHLGIFSSAMLLLLVAVDAGSFANPFSMSGTLHLDPHVRQSDSMVQRSGRPLVLLLGKVSDARNASPARKVGVIHTNVMNIAGSVLLLDQDVSAQILKTLKNQLAADGFQTVEDSSVPHDVDVELVAKDFRLDIVDQDELDIDVEMTLRDAKNGNVLRAGSVIETSSRFAGVSGDTRGSIVRYFNNGLTAWAVKASEIIRDGVSRAYPQTVTVIERNKLAPELSAGLTSVQETAPKAMPPPAIEATPPLKPQVPVPMQLPASVQVPASEPVAATAAAVARSGAKGVFSVTTVPSKANVYSDDVYYGNSPLKLEFDPGVVTFHFKLDGYKSVTQKVSIRRGETTELAIKFER